MPSKIPSILPPLKMENLWKNRNRTSERAGYKWLVYNTYFFSTNIQSEQRATGSKASDGALSTRIDSSHKYKHLPTLQELTYTPILAVFQKSLLTAIPPQHTV